MQTVERDAAQLARQFHAAPPRQQAHLATVLVKFCNRQPQGREWQDAAGRAAVVAAIVQALKVSNAALQQEAIDALARLFSDHHGNKSAAAAAGAVPHLFQLTKSSNTALQLSAVRALGCLVSYHHDNQSAAAAVGAVPHVMQLTKSSNAALQQAAVNTLARFEQGPTEPPSAAA